MDFGQACYMLIMRFISNRASCRIYCFFLYKNPRQREGSREKADISNDSQLGLILVVSMIYEDYFKEKGN